MKRSKPLRNKKPMKRTGWSRVGKLSDGTRFSAHGGGTLDTAGERALASVLEAGAKHLRSMPDRKTMRRRSKKMAAKYAGETCAKCGGGGEEWYDNGPPGSERGVQVCRACGGTGRTEGRAAFVARILKSRPTCEAGHLIGAWILAELRDEPLDLAELRGRRRRATDPIWDACGRRSVDVHEILARSAGGDILDEANVLAVCRCCHGWIGDNPKPATKLGLRKSRYEGRNT